jgi:hypothetical protein
MDILAVSRVQIVAGSLDGESPQLERAVTIKAHQTYMNLTDVFFKLTFAVDL